MSENHPSQLSEETAQTLLLQLRRKEGTWVDWGKACHQLQKAGYLTAQIFEETGFEGSQQNLVIVAAQVYESLTKVDASEALLSYCRGPRSDVLYEFRILGQSQRLAAAKLAMEKQLDVDDAKEVARAIKQFSRFSRSPEGFSSDPGDAVAYQCWQRARSKKDLQARSRLIAKGLRFAQSSTARERIEQLLSDFTVVSAQRAPLLPLYRLQEEEQIPRVIPVAGEMPLTPKDIEAIAKVEKIEPFGMVQYSGSGAYVPIPGWQAVLRAEDPVALFCNSDRLPDAEVRSFERVAIVVDRDAKEWDANSYFLVEQEGELDIQWFPEAPKFPILGQVIVILRPKRILDEDNLMEPWQMDD
ncbi:hypothetical protein IQ249_04505 [Lusitaniella coriacea LEGE 07157]|uniref:RuBisCO accumulation factor 1 n=1 Tax=Lusitaniella coriacea LEGE 07157 TaxID=945747 RepID=A0A8J7B0T9_9CYAN|nr:RuBisCO accumulation factor 1 [Lusitaniella coriacea]MBE9115155.1 hypothetical protein [Lusitaniella coriacea LEGE 07157]